jgi:hypothetical protein
LEKKLAANGLVKPLFAEGFKIIFCFLKIPNKISEVKKVNFNDEKWVKNGSYFLKFFCF